MTKIVVKEQFKFTVKTRLNDHGYRTITAVANKFYTFWYQRLGLLLACLMYKYNEHILTVP